MMAEMRLDNQKSYTIFTDGSCLNNGKKDAKGGCAFVVKNNETEEIIFSSCFKPEQEENITNNRCEMMAMIKALEFIKKNELKNTMVKSDSLVIINGINGLARRNANKDLWDKIEENLVLINKNKGIIKFEHIFSKINPADGLAKQAALALILEPEAA